LAAAELDPALAGKFVLGAPGGRVPGPSPALPASLATLGHVCKRPFMHTLLNCRSGPEGGPDRRDPAKGRKSPVVGRLVGYARVSTDEQGTDPQLDELRAAGCSTILEEHASGTDRGRPVLARLLHEIRAGETLVVRLDRLARSVSHLLAVIEQLEAAGGISAACAIRSTPRRPKACSRCRCWAPSPSLSGR
jgi:Resolvase, N terminal domain